MGDNKPQAETLQSRKEARPVAIERYDLLRIKARAAIWKSYEGYASRFQVMGSAATQQQLASGVETVPAPITPDAVLQSEMPAETLQTNATTDDTSSYVDRESWLIAARKSVEEA